MACLLRTLAVEFVLLHGIAAVVFEQCGELACAETVGHVLLQRDSSVAHAAVEREKEPGGEPEEEGTMGLDARFLIQATFGPTRVSLSALHGKTYSSWVMEQALLEGESHREFYRQRANPRFSTGVADGARLRSPCAAGSRWHRFAFTGRDKLKSIQVHSGKIYVDGAFRTDIEGPPLESRWVGLAEYSGFICHVQERVGSDVHVAPLQNCKGDKKTMPNPALWLASSDGVHSAAGLTLDRRFQPDVFFADRSPTEPCTLDDLAVQNGEVIVHYEGEYFKHDARQELLLNAEESPTRESHACVPRHSINEQGCRLPRFSKDAHTVAGLTMEVQSMRPGRSGYISTNSGGDLLAEMLAQDINYTDIASMPSLFPQDRYFAARWTGSIKVEKEGTYTFWLESDDGSRLAIDNELLITNDGFHGMVEKSGSAVLAPGSHPIDVEYFHGDKVFGGIVLRWRGPDSNDEKAVVPARAFSTHFRAYEEGCFVACGSPGEVANEPARGHHFAIDSASRRRVVLHTDLNYDNRYSGVAQTELTKSTVWFAKALGAKDQLRQRAAWGLSQIFVVSVQGLGEGHLSEAWVAYYDIFVRHSLGRFRDLLREVTYSPLMGRYLTNTGSSSFAYDGKHPNENYAREVMQLFTIGLNKLSLDGTPVHSETGMPMPSYDNEQILNLARVFTGFVEQPGRGNIELDRRHSNLIDPLMLRVERHDIFPKPNLDGNYLGDGFPLCSDTIPPHAYLAKGARFEFRGFSGSNDMLELSANSALFDQLCGGSDETDCTFRPVVELEQTLECTGAECGVAHPHFVAVGNAYYAFMRPICVHLSVRESIAKAGEEGNNVQVQPGLCVDGEHVDIKAGVHRLDRLDGDSQARQDQCLVECKRAGGTGCELVWGRRNKGCMVHMGPVASGDGRNKHMCWVFNATHNALHGNSYEMLPSAQESCPAGTGIASVSECRQAVQYIGLSPTREAWTGTSNSLPAGCSWDGSRAYWNFGSGARNSRFSHVCRAHVVVTTDGKLAMPDGGTKLAVQWLEGIPAAGTHLVSSTLLPVFDRVPTKQELQARLFIGSYGPSDACFVCDGEVRAHGELGHFGLGTVFEMAGKFYRNVESIVHIDGAAFRNPPVFLRTTYDDDGERSALAEVEALLDHLFLHTNTRSFIGKRLIQRFTTSNPPPQYIADVGEAFRSGTCGELHFSGRYGDLAATMAAILLHPEARGQHGSQGSAASRGALREPILKFVHIMRAMEYEDLAKGPVVFRRLQEVIGQFPYEAPTVFNFFLADYELPSAGEEPEAESEEEEEEEAGAEEDDHVLVSPEFQIFTPAYFMGYLNGMASLIQSGVSEDCAGGDGAGLGIRVMQATEGRWRDVCPQGRLMFEKSGSMEVTLDELDLLLTGGRLTPTGKEMVRAAYRRADPEKRLQDAQQAIIMTAEFNTLGDSLPLEGVRPAVVSKSTSSRRPYKAMVMLFLSGGADTFNMLVPYGCGNLYQEYRDVRTDLALEASELIQVSTSGQACEKFGIHGRFSALKTLYEKGEAAFVSNVGNLLRPTTMGEVQGRKAELCFGQFSHSDQQNGAQTLKCQDFGTGARGAGGRIADVLSAGSQKYTTTSFSLAGNAIWPQGVETKREIVDEKISIEFGQYEEWRTVIGNITGERHGNEFSEAYAKAFLDAIETAKNLGQILDRAVLKTEFPTQTSLARQLYQVAKLISTREGRQAERDFFFVSTGGWDMHTNMKEKLAEKFQEIDDALSHFVAEMEAQGIWEGVVLFSSSEFGRTLASNGGGSDHAWAGNHFVIGGGLRGGRIFNKFPSSLAEGSYNMGRGRLIPEYPWESMMVPMATWMGLGDSLAEVFPNIGNFNSTHLISKSDLFKS